MAFGGHHHPSVAPLLLLPPNLGEGEACKTLHSPVSIVAIVIKAEPVIGASAYPLYDTTLLSYRALAGGGTVRRTIHLLDRDQPWGGG